MREGDGMIFKAILSGILISIGCCLYATIGGVMGAFLFSLGLLSICLYKLKLYTGSVGLFLTNPRDDDNIFSFLKRDILWLTGIFIGNALGCIILWCIVYLGKLDCLSSLVQIANAKLAMPFPEVFVKAVLCGGLMELGVNRWRYEQEVCKHFKSVDFSRSVVTIMAVMAFILLGAEHSVPDTFYLSFMTSWSYLKYSLFIAVCAIGNGLGAVITYRCIGEGK